MKIKILAFGSVLLFAFTFTDIYSQSLLNKIKKQTEDKVLKKTDQTIDDVIFGNGKQGESGNTGSDGNTSSPSGNSSSGTANTTGSGLVVEPPDVLKNIKDTELAFNARNYGSAKYAARQAMLGIEMEIGHNILASLPSSVDGLGVIAEKDKVTSMSYGFVGLMMERTYQGGNKELKVSIGNNSALVSAASMMLSSGAYATSDQDQGYKQTTFKGYRSIIQYDDASGYTLSVPFGQSSIFVLNGINYASEGDIMNAAENFDIESIKQELGEK
jgi:hypothetical protein